METEAGEDMRWPFGATSTSIVAAVLAFISPENTFAAIADKLAQGLAVARDVGEDDEHVEPLLERKVLGDGQRRARGQQPLDRGIFGDVEEEDRSLERRALGEARPEECGLTLGHAHRGEDDDELIRGTAPGDGRLRRDLGCELGGREAETGEDRQLLSAHERVQTVDCRDPGLDELVRMVAGDGVDRRSVDVAAGSCCGVYGLTV